MKPASPSSSNNFPTFPPLKVMWLEVSRSSFREIFQLVMFVCRKWGSAAARPPQQLCVIVPCLSGLQGRIWKRGKITEKVIREKYPVIVKKPLGTCQGSLVRRPETVSTVSPLGASQSSPRGFKHARQLPTVCTSYWSCAWQRISSTTRRFLTSLQIKLRSCPRRRCSFKYQV